MKILSLLLVFASSIAMGAGFEKTLLFSGKYNGQGGASVAVVDDSEAVFFNPAALGGQAGSMSLNFSPIFSDFSGPHIPPSGGGTATKVESSDTGFSPVFGVSGSYMLTDKLTMGFGVGVVGGTNAEYSKIDFSTRNSNYNTLQPDNIAKLSIIEFTLAAGYDLKDFVDGLKFGLGWRGLMVQGDYAAPGLTSVAAGSVEALTETRIEDISAFSAGGFRVGLMYAPEQSIWGLGVNFRNSVPFKSEGLDRKTKAEVGLTSTYSESTAKADVSSKLPLQLNVGGFVKFTEDFKWILEYSFTNYGKVGFLGITGLSNSVTNTTAQGVDFGWNDQHVIKNGFNYRLSDMTMLRAGYTWVSQVTASDRARATLAAPSSASTVTLGAGFDLTSALALNVAGDYTWSSGTGSTPLDSFDLGNSSRTVSGEFDSTAYAAHLGMTYRY